MSNVSVESKKGNYTIINKLTYPEAVNEQLFNAIASGMFAGMLPLEKQIKRNETSIICNVRGLTPLTGIFSRPISKAIFLDIVSKLITQFKLCESNGMNPNNIDAAADRMFINLSNGEFSCIYWPLVNNRAENPPYRFLKELPNNVNFVPDEDKSYVTEYKEFFADITAPFSVNRLQELVYKLMGIEAQTEQTPFETDSSFGNAPDAAPNEVKEYDPLAENNVKQPVSAVITEVAEEPCQIQPPVRYCTNCGKKNVHEFFFCTDCGTRLAPLPTPAEQVNAQPEAPSLRNNFGFDDSESRTVSVEAAMLFGLDPKTAEPINDEKQNTATEYDPFSAQTAESAPVEPICDDGEVTCCDEVHNESVPEPVSEPVLEADNIAETVTGQVEQIEPPEQPEPPEQSVQSEPSENGIHACEPQPEAVAVEATSVVSAWASMFESDDEPTAEPVTDLVAEPVAEPVTDFVAEPVAEPVAESEAVPVAEEPITEAPAEEETAEEETVAEEPIAEEPVCEVPVTEETVIETTDDEESVQMPEPDFEDDDGSSKTVAFYGMGSEKTVVLPRPPKFVKQLFVFRLRTGEKAAVNKPEFYIGKERRNCDFTVTENNAVSRQHLKVITREGRYFVTDLKSTNGTYIDDKEIAPDCETEIFPEARVRLADEEFVFYIDEVLA